MCWGACRLWKDLHLQNSYKTVTINLSSRGNYRLEVNRMCHFDCSALWQLLCQLSGFGC